MARGPKSTVKRLPPEILTDLNRLLSEGRLTYDELHAWLQAKGGDVSRSALHRYSADFDKVAKALREKREIARAMAAELGAEADMSPLLIEQLHAILFRMQSAMVAGAEGEEAVKTDAKELRALATTVRQLSLASRDQVKLKGEIREELAKAAEKAARQVIEGQSGERAVGGAAVLAKIREVYGLA